MRAVGGEIWLDLSRLLWRGLRGHLTGIDRVELAYAGGLAASVPDRLRFVILNPAGRFVFLPRRATLAFVSELSEVWRGGDWGRIRWAAAALNAASFGMPGLPSLRLGHPFPAYLSVSHRNLDREGAVAAMLARTGAAFIPLIHDLIPIENPEYARPGEEGRHLKRMATVSRLADAVIVNSAATRDAMRQHVSRHVPSLVALLGVNPPPSGPPPPPPGRPYFLCVGTIEPRKNHLLLLHMWRDMAARLGDAVPELVLVGKRGWENENIVDLLDRCRAIRPHVRELSGVSDAELSDLMRGARAVLMPSFAEGYGLPVAEALAHGVPVLCSDLSAHREVGRSVPEYLAPLDAPSWGRAIMDYVPEESPRRAAQLLRMPEWTRPDWADHVSAALEFVDRVCGEVPMAARDRHEGAGLRGELVGAD